MRLLNNGPLPAAESVLEVSKLMQGVCPHGASAGVLLNKGL